MDSQRLVDGIREFLRASDQTLTPQVKELAAAYAEACQEINRRLNRCAEFLQKGLRSEAIHLAQVEPPLLDTLGTLDFPERVQWADIMFSYSLPVPPPFNADQAAVLNEAYSAEEPLKDLLRRHRRLALAHAPLKSRLVLLRHIAAADGTNPVWQDDVRDFEKARFQQMQASLQEALRTRDASAIVALHEELSTTQWQIAPPQTLMSQIAGLAKKYAGQKSLQSIRDIERQITEAINAFDVPRARSLRDQLKELLKQHGPVGDPALEERLASVFDWVTEQERREAQDTSYRIALQNLIAALDSNEPLDIVEKLAAALRKCNQGMPEDVERRYQETAGRLQQAAARRRMILFGAWGTGAAAALIVAFLGVQMVLQSRRAETAVEILKQHFDKQQWTEARAYLSQLEDSDPKILVRPEVAKLMPTLIDAEKKEGDRLKEFDQFCREAEERIDDPNNNSLARAESKATSPEEKSRVSKLRQLQRDRRTADINKRESQLRPRYAKLENEVRQLEAELQGTVDLQTLAPKLRLAREESDKLRAEGSEMTKAFQGQLQTLVESIGRLQRRLDQFDGSNKMTERLSEALLVRDTPVSSFLKILDQYVQEFLDFDRSRDFRKSREEQHLWQAVLDFNLLTEKRIRWFEAGPEQARAQALELKSFLDKQTQFVDKSLVREYVDYLEGLAQQDDTNPNSAAARLHEFFRNELIRNVWAVRMTDGRTFYLSDVAARKLRDNRSGNPQFPYYIGAEKRTRNAIVNRIQIQGIDESEQWRIAQKLPAKILPRQWADELIALAQQIRQSQNMDPILQLGLYKTVLTFAESGSAPLKLALEPHMKALRTSAIDTSVNWCDPENKEAAATRKAARIELEKQPALDDVVATAAKKLEDLKDRMPGLKYQLAGWLGKNRDHWTVYSARTTASGQFDLFVIVPDAKKGASWVKIGRRTNGIDNVSEQNAVPLLEGRLVFARE